MNDLVYFLAGPIVIGIFGLLYVWTNKEWKSLTTDEIHKLWDANVDKFGTVEQFARDLERALKDKNT